MSDQAKLESNPDAQPARAAQTLPFGGKFAAVLLLLVAVAALILAAAKAYYACAWATDIPPWNCVWDKSTGMLRKAEVYTFAAGGVVLLWLALSVAVFVWRWADGLLFGGKWAIVSLAAIIVGESVITEFWQGYVNSIGKVTDKLVWVLLLWFVVAWRGKSIMGWINSMPGKAKEWFKDSVTEAVEAPVNAVKESVKDATQTMKETADGITKELHDTAVAAKRTAENTAEGVKNMSKRAYTAAEEGVTAAANVATDTVTAAGKTIADIPNQALSAIKGSRSEDEQAQDSTPEQEKGAAEKPAEENTQTEEKGIFGKLGDVFSSDKKDKDKGGD